MKKILLFLIIVFSISTVEADTIEAGTKTIYSYSATVKSIQEVMKDYYLRGINIQYHSLRGRLPGLSPENATTQDVQYQVCANYYYDVFHETFGMTNDTKKKNWIASSLNCIDQGATYYNKIKNSTTVSDGHYLLYFENKIEKNKYIYNSKNNEMSISDFAKQLLPGDIIAWKSANTTGHVEIVYDVIKDKNGKIVDALILGSGGGLHVPSRLDETSNGLRYRYTDNTNKKNGIVDVSISGTIFPEHLINSYTESKLSKNKMMSCQEEKCVVLRPFYNKDNKTVFNYDIETGAYLRSYLRTKYPGLVIEKTVNKFDNNSVYPGDTLEYTIKLTNKSSATNAGKDKIKYSKFTIKEEINTNLVEYKNNNSGCIIDSSKKILTCVIDGLEADSIKTIKYSVQVKNVQANAGKVINSIGKVYGDSEKYQDLKDTYITTGTVSNTIIPKLSKESKNNYKACYNNLSNSMQGKELINEIYKCAWGKDYHFDKFDFKNMIEISDPIVNLYGDTVTFANLKTNTTQDYTNFKNMILNKYWASLVYREFRTAGNYKLILSYAGNRYKYNIIEEDFKDGDVLIYYTNYYEGPDGKYYSIDPNNIHTNENGYYAYIYLKDLGGFVGINYPGQINARNKFTYEYYANITINKMSGYQNHLYKGISSLPESEKKRVLKRSNYETLFEKNSYVIFRPEILIAKEQSSTVTKKTNPITVTANQSWNPIYKDISQITTITSATNAQGTVTYKISSQKDKSGKDINHFTLSGTSLTMKAGTSVGTYTIVISASAAGNASYYAGSKNITMTVTVKPTSTLAPTVTSNSNKGVNPTSTPIPTKTYYRGDIDGNGVIQVADYVSLRNYFIKTKQLSNDELKRADVNNDGKINPADYNTIMRILLKFIEPTTMTLS